MAQMLKLLAPMSRLWRFGIRSIIRAFGLFVAWTLALETVRSKVGIMFFKLGILEEPIMSRSNENLATVRTARYAAPTLKVYGDVTVLTAAGTAGISESTGGTGPGSNCSNDRNRRAC